MDVKPNNKWLLSLEVDCEEAKRASINWLQKHSEKMIRLQKAGDVAYHCFLFIPPPAIVRDTDLGLPATTSDALTSMNTSYLLAFRGIYPGAFHALRQTLEMSVLCSYFSLNELGTGRITAWREGKYRPPMFSKMLKKIEPKYSTSFGLKHRNIEEYYILYSKLSSWTHSYAAKEGYYYSTFVDGRLHFQEEAFEDWVETFEKTIRLSLVLLLITFPSYTLELPEEETPDAWAGPWNFTFPNPKITCKVAEFIGASEWATIRSMADTDGIGKQLRQKWRKF